MIDNKAGLPMDEVNQLLEPGYMSIEAGYYRLPNGDMHVRTLTRMPRCKGKMVDWWFGYIKDTETYKMWHPESHRYFEWDEHWSPGHYIGASHISKEDIGNGITTVRIQFFDPAEIFDTSELAKVGVAVCANAFNEQGNHHGRLVHFIRDTDYGCEMRNRFWLLHNPPDEIGPGVLKHNLDEMGNLADFLPDLYAKENPSQ